MSPVNRLHVALQTPCAVHSMRHGNAAHMLCASAATERASPRATFGVPFVSRLNMFMS